MSEQPKKYQVAVLGGGITGAAIFHILSKYTDIDSIALIEKCPRLGQVNSHESNNSQTLHFGDIETNYSLEKAKSTKAASEMVMKYLNRLDSTVGKKIYSKSHKMALAVGNEEVAALEKRYDQFKTIFPGLKKIGREEIAKIEPAIVNGRKASERLLALYSDNGYAVDFGRLAEALAKDAQTTTNKTVKICLETKVEEIKRLDGCYEIRTNRGNFSAEAIVVAMCSHSLMFAKSLGYGKDFSILPVGGNFYATAHKVLNGKIYTMQNGKLPFAAIHGDPNLHNEDETRFGPTANIMPLLERKHLDTFTDFTKVSINDGKSLKALLKVVFEPLLFGFLLRSLIYDIPFLGTYAYVKLCRKIIPELRCADFRGGKSKAGIRPQLIDCQARKLMMGEVEIVGNKILFNVTPSPGATACLKNAAKSVEKTIEFFDGKYSFDAAGFDRDFR